jgi:CRISPR-associated protein Cmr2
MNADWNLKLAALLHDPPDKVLGLEGHEKRTLGYIEQLLEAAAFQQIFGIDAAQLLAMSRRDREAALSAAKSWGQLKKADAVASAMDRAAFPFGLQFRWTAPTQLNPNVNVINPVVRHPLSGHEHRLSELTTTGIEQAINDLIQQIASHSVDEQKRFLLLWRLLPDLLCDSLGKEWRLLPADTRIVDHTLWEHLSVTAALATALPQPALLVFTIGPVQEFIATARRTQDLWMGSYILSWLTWQGIRVIAEQFGPDAVLYPSLRGQPLVDHWLRKTCKLGDVPLPTEELSRATLPNKFVALLPASEAIKVAEVAENVVGEVRGAWDKASAAVANWLQQDLKISIDDKWHKLWNTHTEGIPECYWSIHCWPNVDSSSTPKEEAEAAQKEYRQFLSPSPDDRFDQIYKTYCQTDPKLVNVGTAYSRLHELAQRGLEARKATRVFKSATEQGAKCTLCGERAALHTSSEGPKEFWKGIAEKLRDSASQVQGLFVAVKVNGQERLCGICAIKRLIQRAYFEKDDVLGLKGGFPSTSSIAAASFMERVVNKLIDPQSPIEFLYALQGHISALQKMKFNRFAVRTASQMLPRLANKIGELSGPKKRWAVEFLCYDGAAFYEENFTVEQLKSDCNLPDVTQAQADAALRSLQRFLAVCEKLKIAKPPRYFAILKFDGDRIRNWLKGIIAPFFADTLHPEATKTLKDPTWKGWEEIVQSRAKQGETVKAEMIRDGWERFLGSRRLLSPALHASLSRALADFALSLAPHVVERQHCGRIIYAGGDDLLALLPVDEVLSAARQLRALFSGQATIDKDKSGEVNVNFADEKLDGFIEHDNKILMTMGPGAAASVGISITHHLSPLDIALKAAREAEKSAKHDYLRRDSSGKDDPAGRNAVCINFLRRSGEQKRVGAQWFYPPTRADEEQLDTLALLSEIQQAFVEDRLSMKFAHAVDAEARTLASVPRPAQEAELRRLLKRQRGNKINREDAEKQAKELAPKLARLAEHLNSHCTSTDSPPGQPQPGMVELSTWLLLTRFLAQGGKE